ncbi:hypothetical protein E2C01_040381 [Portunus trituberculatus]|uniref:Uncharacterized protein n=1 Tax=Portunus trituberculatus TaxID=210409 RepID=A0A5B7FME0_PORTR|nr:hypothetical protein [Portunus trituberculatus]
MFPLRSLLITAMFGFTSLAGIFYYTRPVVTVTTTTTTTSTTPVWPALHSTLALSHSLLTPSSLPRPSSVKASGGDESIRRPPFPQVMVVMVVVVLVVVVEVVVVIRTTTNGDNSKNRGTVEPCVLWGPRGLQAHGFESCPQSECRLGFLTQGNGFLEGGL